MWIFSHTENYFISFVILNVKLSSDFLSFYSEQTEHYELHSLLLLEMKLQN